MKKFIYVFLIIGFVFFSFNVFAVQPQPCDCDSISSSCITECCPTCEECAPCDSCCPDCPVLPSIESSVCESTYVLTIDEDTSFDVLFSECLEIVVGEDDDYHTGICDIYESGEDGEFIGACIFKSFDNEVISITCGGGEPIKFILTAGKKLVYLPSDGFTLEPKSESPPEDD